MAPGASLEFREVSEAEAADMAREMEEDRRVAAGAKGVAPGANPHKQAGAIQKRSRTNAAVLADLKLTLADILAEQPQMAASGAIEFSEVSEAEAAEMAREMEEDRRVAASETRGTRSSTTSRVRARPRCCVSRQRTLHDRYRGVTT